MTLRIYLHKPKVILAARFDAQGQAITYPRETLVFDGITTGSVAALREGMTILLGSAANKMDYGRLRYRYMDESYPTSVMHVSRFSQGTSDGEATLVDDCHITVLEEYLVWAKIPQLLGGAIWKDTDIIPFGHVNLPPPVANGGPGFAGTIDDVTGKMRVTFDGSNSFYFSAAAEPPDVGVNSYLWEVGPGTLVSGTTASQSITVDFPAGFCYVYLTVTGDPGSKAHTCCIPVFARDTDNDDAFTRFNIVAHTQTLIGQEVSVEFYQKLDKNIYRNGMLMMMWDDQIYSDPALRNHMQFIGWHHQDDNNIRAEATGTLTDTRLTFFDVAKKLEVLPGFPQVVEYNPSPTTWTATQFGNLLYYIWYLLYYHSTALEVADFLAEIHTLSAYKFAVVGSDRQNLNAQVQGLAAKATPDHRMTCSRRGQLMMVADLMIQNVADRPSTVMDHFHENEWTAIQYTYTHVPRVQQIQTKAIVSGNDYILVDGVETLEIIASAAPGQAVGQGEQFLEIGERITFNQFDLNVTEGNRYAYMNRRYGPFTITTPFETLDIGLDLAFAKWAMITIADQNLPYREATTALESQRGVISEMSIQYESQPTGLLRTVTLRWEMETSGKPAETVVLWPDSPEVV